MLLSSPSPSGMALSEAVVKPWYVWDAAAQRSASPNLSSGGALLMGHR